MIQTDRHRYLPRRIVPKNPISGRSKCPERFPVIPYCLPECLGFVPQRNSPSSDGKGKSASGDEKLPRRKEIVLIDY